MKKSDDEIPLSPAFFLVMSSSSFPSVYGGEYSRSNRRKNLGNSSLDHCVGLAVLSTTSHGCQQEERREKDPMVELVNSLPVSRMEM